MAEQGSAGNVIAALVNVFLPGVGQLIQGRILAAAFFFVIPAVGYALWWLIIPAIIGGIVHLWAIIDAARWSPR